ncbi:hypothetical protein AC481_01990 [miscellaneous Crenarchaeota group archaeon SMTZ-80]|nr:MAG: hypothetical protein AC481_01990 [miscellaneous Crenarchaeota group archaeon SMTZ-80]
MSQVYLLQPYGTDKIKIISVIVGVCSLLVGLLFFFYFFIIISNMILGLIFLVTFLTAGIIFLIIGIYRQFKTKPKYYYGPVPQSTQNTLSRSSSSQYSYYPNYSRRSYGNWQYNQNLINPTIPQYAQENGTYR